MTTEINDIRKKFPFLSGIKHLEQEYIGIIQNSDDKIISFYDFSAIKSAEDRKTFLECGEMWWWESSRILPIHIFLQGQMREFRGCLKTVVNKEVEILFGPVTSLNNIMSKRIKKRQIQLVAKS
jgi:hypothetical protein